MTRKSKDVRVDNPEKKLQLALRRLPTPLSSHERKVLAETIRASAQDPFGDGDQSPVPDPSLPFLVKLRARDPSAARRRNYEAQEPLQAAWETFLDLQLTLQASGSSFYRDCYHGRVVDVQNKIKEAQRKVCHGNPDCMKHLLEKRISLMRLTPLHVCCVGSVTLEDSSELGESEGPDRCFAAVIENLCKAGANVDARDICGYTPLFYLAGVLCPRESASLLVPLLLEHGADPDAKSRFGRCVLSYALEAGNMPAFRDLVAFGVDTLARDNIGATPFQRNDIKPQTWEVWGHMRRQMALTFQRCSNCRKFPAKKFCSGCRGTYYCSQRCQLRAWKHGHKELCKVSGYWVDVVLDTMTKHEKPGEVREKVFDSMRKDGIHDTELTSGEEELVKNFGSRLEPTGETCGKHFAVFVSRAVFDDNVELEEIEIRSAPGPALLVRKNGPGRLAFYKLLEFLHRESRDSVMACAVAKWLDREQIRGAAKRIGSHVLQVDISKSIPMPTAFFGAKITIRRR